MGKVTGFKEFNRKDESYNEVKDRVQNYNEFTVISEGTYLEAPTDWTLYEFDLSSYVGQNVRIGINYISDDKFVLQMDEFVVEGTLGINDDNLLEMILYPNPTDKNFVTIQTNSLDTKEIEVFDIIGKKVIDVSLNTNSLDVSKLNSGIYLVKITVDNQTNTHKLVVK